MVKQTKLNQLKETNLRYSSLEKLKEIQKWLKYGLTYREIVEKVHCSQRDIKRAKDLM